MFWVWLEWQLTFVEPVSTLGDEVGTYRMNDTTKFFWRAMPMELQGLAIILEILEEE